MSRVASQAENVRAATREGGVVPVRRRRRKGERGGWLGLIGMDYQDKAKDVQAGERHRKRERDRNREARAEQVGGGEAGGKEFIDRCRRVSCGVSI